MINQFLATTDAVSQSLIHPPFVLSAPIRDQLRSPTFSSVRPPAPNSIPLQTIVSTSLPTIVADLKGSQNQYAWVGVAYLLTQTACQPVYGKLADIFGRKVRAGCNLLVPFLTSISSVCPLHKYRHLSCRISPLRCCSGGSFSFFGIAPPPMSLSSSFTLPS